jgi:hypothetical protein
MVTLRETQTFCLGVAGGLGSRYVGRGGQSDRRGMRTSNNRLERRVSAPVRVGRIE